MQEKKPNPLAEMILECRASLEKMTPEEREKEEKRRKIADSFLRFTNDSLENFESSTAGKRSRPLRRQPSKPKKDRQPGRSKNRPNGNMALKRSSFPMLCGMTPLATTRGTGSFAASGSARAG